MARSPRIHGIVLSGGEGKRLRPLTYYFQKCMIPVGPKQKPLLEYVVRLLGYNGIKRITLLVGYKSEQIVNYFNGGGRFGVKLDYGKDSLDFKGTGGSLIKAFQEGLIGSGETLLVYYGDILSSLNIAEMMVQHREDGVDATLAVTRGYQVSVGVADVEGNRIIGWTEKPFLDINAGIGVMALESDTLEEFCRLDRWHDGADIMGDFLTHLVESGRPVGCYSTNAFWYDVGSVERYEKLDNGLVDNTLGYLFERHRPLRPMLRTHKKTITSQGQTGYQ